MEKLGRKPRFLSDLGRSSTLPDLLERHIGSPKNRSGAKRNRTVVQNLERKNVELIQQLGEERRRNRELREKLDITKREKIENLESMNYITEYQKVVGFIIHPGFVHEYLSADW